MQNNYNNDSKNPQKESIIMNDDLLKTFTEIKEHLDSKRLLFGSPG